MSSFFVTCPHLSSNVQDMSTFALLWGKILDSSLWVKESKETRLVWVTILAMKDLEGRVYASVIGLADRAKVTPDECRTALRIFLSPDPDDTSKVEDGKRLREIPGGWQVVNNELYRFSTDEKREFWRQQKAEQRAAKEAKKNGKVKKLPLDDKTGERGLKAVEDNCENGAPMPPTF